MILSLMVLAIVLSLSVGAGYLVTRPLRLGDAPATDRLFFSAAAGFGVISIMPLEVTVRRLGQADTSSSQESGSDR
ncbi:MAG: hypothetical protein CME13_00815 [Gemmatimonadetes bacterium]|jgi:hypothetical protein|uniref:Uncharacterized protein n=1 Tax=marine metagenome TaxID=408172 RepID=A0A382FPN6_9ZZZZ|nr:hypothetical protein [Gemmatimonadota bacterium]HCV25279.1 hypothetical protein [Candidatus Latescibacterota bacterium]|tara:strand:+ start:578 stop:805 length:228 start_codon:yes stop_codon:yes gene_type:complete